MEFLKEHALLGFITPDTWLTILSAKDIRSFLNKSGMISEIVDMYKPFPDSKDTRTHSFLFERSSASLATERCIREFCPKAGKPENYK